MRFKRPSSLPKDAQTRGLLMLILLLSVLVVAEHRRRSNLPMAAGRDAQPWWFSSPSSPDSVIVVTADAAAPPVQRLADAIVSARPVHITHVFSTFTARNNSDTALEMDLVQQSWQAAAMHALVTKQIVVEFIDATLPVDDGSVPSWARHAALTRSLEDVVKGRIATVGEPFEVGAKLGRGTFLIATNADIGAMVRSASRGAAD
jgi:hypothetical protein